MEIQEIQPEFNERWLLVLLNFKIKLKVYLVNLNPTLKIPFGDIC